MATKMVEKVQKFGYRVTITHVGKDAKGKDVIYSSVDIRAKAEDEVTAFALALKDSTAFAGTLDESSIDPNNPVTARIAFPDQSFAYVAINLSDTQCDVCGAPEGVYNPWCPTCIQREKDSKAKGNGNKASALLAALQAKDTRRGK